MLAPLLACCDVRVPMISGRGLGLTGGTLDKLSRSPVFAQVPSEEAARLLTQSRLPHYRCRRNAGPSRSKTVQLTRCHGNGRIRGAITASILSKKLAASLDALVMDVKVGSGAFMKTRAEAKALADSLVQTGKRLNLPVSAFLTDMDQPRWVKRSATRRSAGRSTCCVAMGHRGSRTDCATFSTTVGECRSM
ncbi:MAG: hypothetical protein R3C05_17620 [Pirellulaceae bacterium]